MHTVQVLNHLIENNQILAYIFIFLGLIFEGEVIVITAGILSYLGALNPLTSLIFILSGGLAKTIGGYYLGAYLHKKYNSHNFFKYLERRVLFFMPRFREKPFWSIFISKFVMGINYLVIIFSGYNKIRLRTFLKAEIIATFIWAPALFSIGFFFSQTALSYSKELKGFSFIILVLVITFLLFDKLVATFYRISQYLKNGINGHKKNNDDCDSNE